MRNGLTKFTPVRVCIAACAAAAIAMTALPSSSVAAPEPSTQEAKAKVERSYRLAEQATERYHAITDQLKDTKAQIKGLRADVAREQKAFDALREEVGTTIAAQLASSPMGPTAQLLSSNDPDEFLDGLSALQVYNSNQSDRLGSYEAKAKELGVRKDQLRSKVASITKAKKKMAREKAELDRNVAAAKDVLSTLTAAQRAAVNDDADHHGSDDASDAGTSPSPSPDAPSVKASGRAKKAIDFAVAQLGDPYSYGANGPDSWDCSGLTGGAWGAAGVSLPRSSSAQAGAGSPVSRGSLSPGDLVFYYSPVSHVGIYMGDGKLVHAPRSGKTVEIVSVDSMPFNSARRVG